MWTKLQDWQLLQLQRMAQVDPERVETLLNALWTQYPGLRSELAIAAVDQEQLSVQDCAELLGISTEEVERQLLAFRHADSVISALVTIDDDRHVARVASGRITVWEIVREFRKIGSLDRLRGSFPSLSERELSAAFQYASEHPDEIEKAISDYEEVIKRRRSEYPFAK